MLQIKDLKVKVDKKEILKGLDLEIKSGEIHAVMGPNGSGKSTLVNAISGNPRYEITNGEVLFEEEDLKILSPEEISLMGIYLCFQYPLAIPGVTVSNFLRTIYNQHVGATMNLFLFREFLEKEIEKVDLDKSFLDRYLNDGFSGGEKKKLEMLQMRILQPKLALLDETDSGLDVDALKLVSKNVLELKEQNPDFSVLIITHSRKILDYIKPEFVHIMIDGKIIKNGGSELIDEVEEKGFEEFKK